MNTTIFAIRTSCTQQNTDVREPWNWVTESWPEELECKSTSPSESELCPWSARGENQYQQDGELGNPPRVRLDVTLWETGVDSPIDTRVYWW
jgi:hypothetical protein